MPRIKKQLPSLNRAITSPLASGYDSVLADVVHLLESARRGAARAVNTIMTATYWEIGCRIVEWEQKGHERARYGTQLIERLSADLTSRFGRGFSVRALYQMREFYLAYSPILQSPSAESAPGKPGRILQSAIAESSVPGRPNFPLPWTHYVRLLSVSSSEARHFYESEALRSGWSVRQLDRQIGSQFYERTALSRDKAAVLRKGRKSLPADAVTPEEEIKDPLVLEFLGLKDEYSESDLEDALIGHLEAFLLELGGDFAFVSRQRRLRIGDEWYRIDLLFFHRRLRCLVVVDLKLGKFTHADAGQMHVYLNYARQHWTHSDENPPVGLILCAEKDESLAHYALEGLSNKVIAARYRTALPDEKLLAAEIARTQDALERRNITYRTPHRSRSTLKRPARQP